MHPDKSARVSYLDLMLPGKMDVSVRRLARKPFTRSHTRGVNARLQEYRAYVCSVPSVAIKH